MTWVFLLILLHADGTPAVSRITGLTEEECHSTERAWLAQFNSREQTDIVVKIRCEDKPKK